MAASEKSVLLPERVSFARIPDIRPMPGLIQIQLDSFEWFKKEGLRELFDEISPIEDFTGKNLKREFIGPPEPFGKPKDSEDECRDRDTTYAAPLTVKAREVKDTSLRVPHGERGKVVKVFSRDVGDEPPPGVNQLVRFCIAQKRSLRKWGV